MSPRARRSESITLPAGHHPVLIRYRDEKDLVLSSEKEIDMDVDSDDDDDDDDNESDVGSDDSDASTNTSLYSQDSILPTKDSSNGGDP
jgi:hypothetical protein